MTTKKCAKNDAKFASQVRDCPSALKFLIDRGAVALEDSHGSLNLSRLLGTEDLPFDVFGAYDLDHHLERQSAFVEDVVLFLRANPVGVSDDS
jgi:hypothetical protein